jgi:hypothetical protein
MANTVIQLKFSEGTATPASLNVAEPAYSNNSNKLFIGLAGNQVIAIGGKYYTDLVDAATDANTVSTIVKRDASGMFSATAVKASLFGNANTATILQTSRLIGVSGDIVTNTVSFNGSTDENLSVTLSATGVTAGTYGGSTNAVVIVVDSKGRITSASNVATSSILNIAGDSGTDAVSLATDIITFVGGDGITTTAYSANSNVRFDVDNTVVRTTGGTISGDLAVTGNLVVSGNTVTQDVETLIVEDSLIQLAANNAADAIDIGLFGQYVASGTKYTALFRDASDSGKYKLLTGGTEKPLAANTVNVAAFSTGTLVSNLDATTITNITGTNLSIGPSGKQTVIVESSGIIQPYGAIQGGNYGGNQIDVTAIGFGTQIKGLYEGVDIRVSSDGSGANVSSFNTNGTLTVAGKVTAAGVNLNDRLQAAFDKANGAVFPTSTLTAGQIIIGAGTNNVTTLANTTYTLTGGLAAANTISSLTVDAYGRVTAATGVAIAIDTAQITSGTIADARLPTKGTAGTYANASHVPVITTDAYGRVTNVTNTAISIDTSQISGGTLGVTRGGTGVASFTANSVLISGATSTSAVVSLNSSTEGHVLQVSSAGVPVFGFLNGGSF